MGRWIWMAACMAGCVAAPPAEPLEDESELSRTLEPGDRFERVPTRPDVTVPLLVVEPSAPPTQGVLLFPGGNGLLQLSDRGIGRGADNFVVRTRARFAQAGFVALVVDAPSDHPDGIDTYRESAEEAEDVRAVISWASAKWPVPFWLAGTSRGTISAANASARGAGESGIILTASITGGRREKLPDLPLDRIAVPAFIVHHKEDGCHASPVGHIGRLERALSASPHVKATRFEGGLPPASGVCGPLSPHGFYGLDAEVVAAIVAFIQVPGSGD